MAGSSALAAPGPVMVKPVDEPTLELDPTLAEAWEFHCIEDYGWCHGLGGVTSGIVFDLKAFS